MPTHPDAVGYVNDLAKEVDEPWFKMVCDLVAVSGTPTPDQQTLDTLFALYTKRASYLEIKTLGSSAVGTPALRSVDFLEELSGFANFKLLGSALRLGFKKQTTLIFGTNGSGKSSLCESLKVLASSEMPTRPLRNLRTLATAATGFRYKFKSDAAVQNWTQASGYGPRSATVKYFDTGIALKHVRSAVEPKRVIVVTPFKLHLFEWITALTTKVRETLQRAKQANAVKLTQALAGIRTSFARFRDRPLATIDERTVSCLSAAINLGEAFVSEALLKEKQNAAAELEKATSEEGLKLLKAEHRELELFLASLKTILEYGATLWALQPVTKAQALALKQTAQEELANLLIPQGASLESLLTLLRAASALCHLDTAEGHACPLCKRSLAIPDAKLFKQYHELLVGELEKEIAALKSDLAKAEEIVIAIGKVNRAEWDKQSTLPAEILTAAKTEASLVVADCDLAKEPTAEAKAAMASLKAKYATWSEQLRGKSKAIETAAKGGEELARQLAALRAEIEPLEYAQSISNHLDKLRPTQELASEDSLLAIALPAFPPLLKRITDTAKKAHEELVVNDFEARLNTEYKALAEKDMTAFGVELARKGTDAAVTVLPQVGGHGIEGVLSEGEQRVHALALFFAELETCAQSVFVFDDPVSSFDYNYIANCSARIRDFVVTHPMSQVIILTHNWEFFVQLQTTMNQAGLDPRLSVQVLENCMFVADYSEKVDDLKADIEAILNATGEPSKDRKEEMAGKMRRLIEAVVNTYVFNHQRHQYKQKSQAVTAFQSFTRIVPLLPAEATAFRDLYSKLSITEHDDPRTAYVNTDKATFQSRYNQVLTIEAAIVMRK